MKVREVINECEALLSVDYTIEDLLSCFNLVENELALDYLPLYDTHKCNSRIVYYTEFQYQPVRIIDCNCKFKIYPEFLKGKEDITEIKYSYVPRSKALSDESSYDEQYLECLAYGTVSEYLCSQGFFEEALLWGKKYKNMIKLLMN